MMQHHEALDTDNVLIRRDVSGAIAADGEVTVPCPICGKEITVGPDSDRGGPDSHVDHKDCHVIVALRSKGYELLIEING